MLSAQDVKGRPTRHFEIGIQETLNQSERHVCERHACEEDGWMDDPVLARDMT